MARGGVSLEVDGLMETIQSVRGISDALERKEANANLRQAARSCATRLSGALARAAAASGVPVAPKVAKSIRVKSDRLPVLSIGGGKTGPLVWGSEQGPKSSPNRFAVDPNPAGYWIAPTVDRFAGDEALVAYRRAVYEILHDNGLA